MGRLILDADIEIEDLPNIIDESETCDDGITYAMSNVLSEDLNNIILEEINIINTNVSRVGLEVDSFKRERRESKSSAENN